MKMDLSVLIQIWNEGAHLHPVEVTHSPDPVHQQRYLHAAVFLRPAGRPRTRLEVLIGSQQHQPLFGPQGSLQEANFIPQLTFIQNYFHLQIKHNQIFISAL